MRPDADKPGRSRIGLFVDEHPIRSWVAVAEVAPRAAESVVTVARFKRLVVRECLDGRDCELARRWSTCSNRCGGSVRAVIGR